MHCLWYRERVSESRRHNPTQKLPQYPHRDLHLGNSHQHSVTSVDLLGSSVSVWRHWRHRLKRRMKMKNLMKEILTINSSETLNSVFKNSYYKLQKYSDRRWYSLFSPKIMHACGLEKLLVDARVSSVLKSNTRSDPMARKLQLIFWMYILTWLWCCGLLIYCFIRILK